MASKTIESPIGPITVTADDKAVVAVDFAAEPHIRVSGGEALAEEAAAQLEAYFAGDRHGFDLPLAPAGTAFRRRVWEAMAKIPFGQTRSYGDLARAVDSAPRAVGGACGANPIPIIIPCHRVVASGGAIGGFSGGAGCATKRRLLDIEAAGFALAP